MPKIFPILFRLPDLVVGIPVAFAILRFAAVMPVARFQLKDRPGIFKLLFFFAISHLNGRIFRRGSIPFQWQ